jgi:maltooligosyltrehalose trehalohydrolase
MGERSAALESEGRLMIAAALLLTSPFTPMLFQGEEWAAATPFLYFTDHEDPELGRAVREGRRAEFASFGWDPESVPDPQDPATFQRSKLDWSSLRHGRHARLLDWHRTLIALRRRLPVLTDPRVRLEASLDDGLLHVRRGPVHLGANLGDGPRCLVLPSEPEVLAASIDLPQAAAGVTGDGVQLPVDSVVLWFEPPGVGDAGRPSST